MTVQFGLRVPTVGKPQETGAYAKRVEAAGFDFMWMPDTPLLAGEWRDVYMHLACAALETTTMRLGPGVTNPMTRHPVTTASAIAALDEMSGGRADLLFGTGYSSAYIVGQQAATRKQMRDATELWRSIFSGATTELGGLAIEMSPPCPKLPIYMAATGPRALQLAGEIADGVLIMVGAAPGCVRWALEQVEFGLAKAGRRREDLRRILVVTTCIDEDRQRAIDEMRPCAASFVRHSHAQTLFGSMGLEVPVPPTGIAPPYPDLSHARDWEEAKRYSAFLPDAAVEAMIALGSPQDVAAHVRSLIECDVDAIWFRDEQAFGRPDALLERLPRDVLQLLR